MSDVVVNRSHILLGFLSLVTMLFLYHSFAGTFSPEHPPSKYTIFTHLFDATELWFLDFRDFKLIEYLHSN